MTKYQKQTIQYSIEEEKKILDTLKRDYKEAGKTIESRIKNLLKREDADLIHVIHQVNYQKALKSQIDDVLDKLNDGTYSSILKYMEDSYGTGFTSSLYRLQKQGVPLIFPMNREEILRAVQTNSKISKKKYGKNFTKMKNTIRKEVTRGISTSMSFGDIARNIDNTMQSGLYNSYRVARTEGHRINQEASFDAMTKAKEAGADVVKKWDSTLDGRTRETHRSLEGQVRELDEPFEVNGKQAMYPSGFGIASEDINCRCVVLEIGRWELDEDDTYSKFDGESGVIVNDLSNIKNYDEFREQYARYMAYEGQENFYWEEAEPIINSPREIEDIKKYISSKGFGYAGLNEFDGSFDLVKEQVEELSKLTKDFPTYDKIYIEFLDLGRGVFGATRKHMIALNSTLMRNRDITLKNLIIDKKFSSENIKSIIRHEYGHMIEEKYKINPFQLAQEVCSDLNLNLGEELLKISEVGTRKEEKRGYKVKIIYPELFPEIFSKHLDNPNKFTEEYIERVKKYVHT